VEAVTPQLQPLVGKVFAADIRGSSDDDAAIRIADAAPQLRIDGKTQISRLSFTHIVELLNLEDVV
jgi:hypothetical protein